MALESYSATRNLARVSAGFKGGNFMTKPMMPQQMTFVQGWPDTSLQKMQGGDIPKPTPADPWNERRSR